MSAPIWLTRAVSVDTASVKHPIGFCTKVAVKSEERMHPNSRAGPLPLPEPPRASPFSLRQA